MCLPMPVDLYSTETFKDLDGWRSRFLALLRGADRLQLSDATGLPKWLQRRRHERVGARKSLGAPIGSKRRCAESVADRGLGWVLWGRKEARRRWSTSPAKQEASWST